MTAPLPAATRFPDLNCDLDLYANFLTAEEADGVLAWCLSHLTLFDHRVVMADRSFIEMEVGKCMFVDAGDLNQRRLLHAGKREAIPPVLNRARDRVEAVVGRPFGVLVGLHYPDGRAGATYHTDSRAFGDLTYIPSLSVGASRAFGMRSKADPTHELRIELPHGSLVVMGPGSQEHYEHGIFHDESITAPRFNFTFRDLDRD